MIPLSLFRALRAQIPDRQTRSRSCGLSLASRGCSVFNPALGRIEINSIEFVIRKMEISHV
jgi:hypothetical protein